MPKLAIILGQQNPTKQQLRLSRILDFFGVPWETIAAPELADIVDGAHDYVIFASVQALAAAFKDRHRANGALRPRAFYVYTSEDKAACEHALQSLCGDKIFILCKPSTSAIPLRVSAELAELAGPMSGLEVSARLESNDAVLVGPMLGGDSEVTTIISAGHGSVFVRFQLNGVPIFFCASSDIVDIDQKVDAGFYDVKDHFCSIVPLVMFLRFAFPETAWRPQELSACLIVDDPLLKPRYGACDFAELRELMVRHEFTTNVAFIPWNWRRTSSAASEFFRKEARHFSVSVHVCDHIAAEFGATSPEILNDKAGLALSRMRNHESRTGIHHEPIMVFPQGVFSSICPEVLKRNGFLAAVNTQTVPVDFNQSRTAIRDVWDVAITAYGGFPIFTRRYARQGLENFAFDLLLGKPCLIASHHEFFSDSCAQLMELIEKLSSLNCRLHWRPLGDVIRRACRRRMGATGLEEVEMYGNELLITNPSDQWAQVRIRKREEHAELIGKILCDGKPIQSRAETGHVVFAGRLQPHGESCFQVTYRYRPESGKVIRSLGFELSVTFRRILSEFRDGYLSKNRFLTTAAQGLKNALMRPN